MSYDINFKVKVEGLTDRYLTVGECTANTTWNLRDMIVKSTGLEWKNEANNGLCKDVIPHIEHGYTELVQHPEKYKRYESSNGWGDIDGCQEFFAQILYDWNEFSTKPWNEDLAQVACFGIE